MPTKTKYGYIDTTPVRYTSTEAWIIIEEGGAWEMIDGSRDPGPVELDVTDLFGRDGNFGVAKKRQSGRRSMLRFTATAALALILRSTEVEQERRKRHSSSRLSATCPTARLRSRNSTISSGR